MKIRAHFLPHFLLGTLLLAAWGTALPQAASLPPPAISTTAAIPAAATSPGRQLSLYANAHPYMDDSLPELKQTVPELKGLREPVEPAPGANPRQTAERDPLPPLLQRLGAHVNEMVQRIPSLVAQEEVTQSEWVSGAKSAPDCGRRILCGDVGAPEMRQTFRYFILVHQTPQGRVLEEDRTDERNRPQRAGSITPNFRGFVESWVVFSPGNAEEARFRYLGEQKTHGHWASVIAFAQIPGAIRLPGEIVAANATVPMLLQGIVWMDEQDGEILQLRTDLLAPQLEVQLLRQTAEIRFGPVRIPQLNLTLWLPQAVDVNCEANGMVFEEQHVYSKYHLYHATTRMIVNPVQ